MESGFVELIKQNIDLVVPIVLSFFGTLFGLAGIGFTIAGKFYVKYEKERNKFNEEQFSEGDRRFNFIETEGERRFKQIEKGQKEIKEEIGEERKENKVERKELKDAISEVEGDVVKIDKNVVAIALHHELTGKKIKGIDF